jgi:CelD/BcsL family acetyltransferase involved in cellulose biosynthesis
VETTVGEELPAFCRWDWTALWLEYFGKVVRHRYLIAERGGIPCGTALLTRSTRRHGPLTIRRLHIGTAGEPEGEGVFVEYNGLCAGPGDRTEFAQAILAEVHRTSRWDELHLDGFDPAHAETLLSVDPSFDVLRQGSRVLTLEAPTGDLVNVIGSKNARKIVRRSLRGISPYHTEWAQDIAGARRIIQELERLHQQRWEARGERGAFSSERFRAFHHALIDRWLPEGRAAVFGVHHGGELVAALYGFVVGDTLQCYQGGFRIFDESKVRVGYAAHMLFADAARQRGLRHYEYLAGDYRYKTELSTGERVLVWATLSRRHPRAMAIRAARDGMRLLRSTRGSSQARPSPS